MRSSQTTETPSGTESEAVVEPRTTALPLGSVAGPLSVPDALRLQRAAGNRTVARMAADRRVLARDVYSTDAKRAMTEGNEKGLFKPDAEFTGPEGDLFVYDAFDRTLTIFTPESGPHKGAAFRMTYVEGTPDEISKLKPNEMFSNTEKLSPVRAKALLWLRGAAGKFQESEDKKNTRVSEARKRWAREKEAWASALPANRAAFDDWNQKKAAHATAAEEARKAKKPPPPEPKRPPGMPIDSKPTNCNQHVGEFATNVLNTSFGGMDPRQQAIDIGRAGAFRTLLSNPFTVGDFKNGPQAGDIISYGQAGTTKNKEGLRKADVISIMHVGVLKSRRPGASGHEIWTVVDGGQGGFENRQETRERVRLFTIEHMQVQVPKKSKKGDFVGYEMAGPGKYETRNIDVGVFKQKPTDYVLRGWIDIDMFAGGKSESDPQGAGSWMFQQKEPAPAPAAAVP